MTTFYLIRHGEAEGNLYRLMHGQTDSDLTELGREQVKKLGLRFRELLLDAVWSSPLRRAMLTAAELCLPKKLPLYTDSRLLEINVGPWEGLPFGTAARQNPAEMDLFRNNPDAWRMPGADTIRGLAARGIDCLRELAVRYPGGTVAVCLHSYLLNAMMCGLFYGFEHFASNGSSYNTAVTRLTCENDQWRIDYANDYTHLTAHPEEKLVRTSWAPENEPAWLSFEPFGDDVERYIRYRGDAWQLIYKEHTKDFNGSGFWLDAQKTVSPDPWAMIHGSLGRTPVGMLQLSPDRDARKKVGYIPFIYLREPFRGKDLGIQFIGQAVMFYRKLGRTRLQLSVAHTNTHALAFYRKYGFIEAGKTPGRYGRLILMEKDISMKPLPKALHVIPSD